MSSFTTKPDDPHISVIVEHPKILPLLLSLSNSSDEFIQEQSLRTLAQLADGPSSANKISEQGTIELMLSIISPDSGNNDATILQASKVLSKLAVTDLNKEAIVASDGFVGLVALLHRNNDLVVLQAVTTIVVLLEDHRWHGHFHKAGGVTPLVKGLNVSNPGIVLKVLQGLALLTTNERMETLIMKVGVLKRFVHLLEARGTSPLLLKQSVQSVEKFSERKSLRKEMFEFGILNSLLTIASLPSTPPTVLLPTARAIANFAMDDEHNAELRAKKGMITLLKLLRTPSAEIGTEVTRALSSLLRHPANRADFMNQSGLTGLVELLTLTGSTTDLRRNVLSCVRSLILDTSFIIPLGRSGIVPYLVDFLGADDEDVMLHSLAVLVTLASSGNPELKLMIRDADGIYGLCSLLAEEPVPKVHDAVILCLANLSDDPKAREMIGEEEGFGWLVKAISHKDERVQERVVWAVSFYAADAENQQELRQLGLHNILNLLGSEKLAPLLLKIILLMINKGDVNKRAIREAGGVHKLSAISSSPNRTVAAAAQKALAMLN